MFKEFVFHVVLISFLVVYLVRFECFVASPDTVLVTLGITEITDAERFQRLSGRVR